MLDKRGLLVSETNIKENIMHTKEITGTPLTEILLRKYADKNENEVYKIFDKIYEEIIRSSEESNKLNPIFNSSDEMSLSALASDDKILKNIYIDMIHKNCFVQENGDYIWIDQEWCLNDIPASFGLYYNIIELYSSNLWIDSCIPMRNVLDHYDLADKSDSYYNLKQAFLNTVQNRYSTFNYWQLSQLNKDNITTNIKLLYNNMYNCKKQYLSETEAKINEILKTGSIMNVIEYVGTLTDEIILKDIPQMPQFIVRYLKADENEKAAIQQSIKRYDDIKNI